MRTLLELLAVAVLSATILSAMVALSLIAFRMFWWAMHDATLGMPLEAIVWAILGLVFLAPNAVGAALAVREIETRRRQ